MEGDKGRGDRAFEAEGFGPELLPPIMDFGVENWALQYLVKHVLEAVVHLHPRQYATRGGVKAAVKEVASALSNGFVWAVEIDVKDCFMSFYGKKLASLIPLPKEVEHILVSEYLNLKGGNLYNLFDIVGPAGDDDKDWQSFQLKRGACRRPTGHSSGVGCITAGSRGPVGHVAS